VPPRLRSVLPIDRRRALLRESHALLRCLHLISRLHTWLTTSHWCLHTRLAALTPELLRATLPPSLSRAASPLSCGMRRAPLTRWCHPPSGSSGPRPPHAITSPRSSSSLRLRTPGNEDRLCLSYSLSCRASAAATSSDKSVRAATERES
jgi:hypothetical protein